MIGGGRLWAFAGTDDAAVTLWQHCRRPNRGCQYAWRVQQDPSPSGVLPHDGTWNVDAAGDRFVITDGGADSGGIVVGLDGSTTPIEAGDPSAITDGVVLVRSTARYDPGYALVDAARGVRWPLGRPVGVDGWSSAALGDDGQIWAFAATEDRVGAVRLWHSPDGGATWAPGRDLTVGDPSMSGYLAASGGHVAALATYDGATVLPVGDLAVTSDDGGTWHDLAQADVPFEYVSTMAATRGGTLYVAGGRMQGLDPDRLYRSTDDTWTHFTEVELPDGAEVGALKPAGATVIGRTGSDDAPTVVSLDDDGRVQPWTEPIR